MSTELTREQVEKRLERAKNTLTAKSSVEPRIPMVSVFIKAAEEEIALCDLAKEALSTRKALAESEYGGLVERLNISLGGIETPAMNGDNLAVTLCSPFDDGGEVDDERGWSTAAVAGHDEAIKAIRDHYKPLAAAITALVAERERMQTKLTAIENLSRPSEYRMNHENIENIKAIYDFAKPE